LPLQFLFLAVALWDLPFFSFITGIIALAFASAHHKYGAYDASGFTDTALAYQSFAIIAGASSCVIGIYLAIAGRGDGQVEQKQKNIGRFYGLELLILYWTVIGLVSALYQKHFFDRSESLGNDFLDVYPERDNYGNAISPFAWTFSIWAGAVGSSLGIEALIKGTANAGIVTLAFTTSANLLGWASQHVYYGSPNHAQFAGTTRAWEGVALTAACIAITVGYQFAAQTRREGQDVHQ